MPFWLSFSLAGVGISVHAAVALRLGIFSPEMIVRLESEMICNHHLRWGQRLALRSLEVRGFPITETMTGRVMARIAKRIGLSAEPEFATQGN